MRTALLIIDAQNGMLALHPVHEAGRVLANIRELLTRARGAEVPVVYVQHDGPPGDHLEPNTAGWAIHDSIAPAAGEPVVRKTTPDSFYGTSLQSVLAERGIDRLVMCGLQSEFCVDTSCRRAFSLGYAVILASDAHSTYDRDDLSARQIIEFENSVLGSWFTTLQTAAEVRFS